MLNEKRLIDANALSKSIKEGSGTELQKFFADVCVATAPTVDAVEVVHGRWLFVNDYKIKCSECFDIIWGDLETEPNYCPNCGANMKG